MTYEFIVGELVTGPEERARVRSDGDPYIGRVVTVDSEHDLVWVEYGPPFNRTTSYRSSELMSVL